MDSLTVLEAPILFASKAQTLDYISRVLYGVRVLPMVYFTVREWASEPDLVLQRVRFSFGVERLLIVRSSSVFEDTSSSSMAGCFRSILDVQGNAALRAAIEEVIASYGHYACSTNEVLIQPMANSIRVSGVITTPKRSDSPQYWVASTSMVSTFDVTSGSNVNANAVFTRGYRPDKSHILGLVFEMADTICTLFAEASLDIEFGVDSHGPILFQVRPLVEKHTWTTAASSEGQKALDQASLDVMHASAVYPQEKIAFGVMPDWNPAEMIGIKPRPLSFDLYCLFMTDSSWAQGRTKLGYRDLSSRKLMHQFAGSPYIDLNASLLSLLPASLSDDTARSIVLNCLKTLERAPHLHDKVEFALVPNVLTPLMISDPCNSTLGVVDWQHRSSLVEALRLINSNIFDAESEVDRAILAVKGYQSMLEGLNAGGINLGIEGVVTFVQKNISWRFSLIARAAFAATAILRELERLGCVPSGFFDRFISRIESISHALATDHVEMGGEKFLLRYGHVRPGTYDIRNFSYKEGYERYFVLANPQRSAPPSVTSNACDKPVDSSTLHNILRSIGIELPWPDFLAKCAEMIKQREFSKYIYSGFVSHSLDWILQWGRGFGLDREQISYLQVSDIIAAGERASMRPWLMERIAANKLLWEHNSSVRAPYLLFRPSDLYGFEEFISQPSFITRGEVKAPAVQLGVVHGTEVIELSGRIVLIESADPGYDWIFARGIAGFVTAFGGENSHMAIRAREFELPAVIGVGESKYRWLTSASFIHIDCSELKVEPC